MKFEIAPVIKSLILAVMVLAFSRVSPAQQLRGSVCSPSDCQSNFGPSTTGAAKTSITGFCSPTVESDTIQQVATITIIVPCKSPVIIETSADSGNTQTLDDCGRLVLTGFVEAFGSVTDAIGGINLYRIRGVSDCAGGVSAPPPAFAGC